MVTLGKQLSNSSNLLTANLFSSHRKTVRFVKTFDIVIVGAGPAGACLAWLLSKQGLDPVIIDHSYPTDKPMAGVVPFCFTEKFPVLNAVLRKEHSDGRVHLLSHSGKRVVVSSGKDGIPAAVSFFNPGRYLLDSAISRGARFIQKRVTGVFQEKGLWKIDTTEHQFRARMLAGADGVKSIVRKAVSKPFHRKDLALLFGYQVSGMEEASLIKFTRGRQGLLKASGDTELCVIEISDTLYNSPGLKNDLDTFLQNQKQSVKIEKSWSVLIPQASSGEFFDQPCAGSNWILLGDAAGHVNPLIGEGILYALWSADLAAQAITAGDMRVYESLWREEYGDDLRRSLPSRDLFFKPGFIEVMLRLAGRSPTFSRQLFSIFSGENTPRGFLKKSALILPEVLWDMVVKKSGSSKVREYSAG